MYRTADAVARVPPDLVVGAVDPDERVDADRQDRPEDREADRAGVSDRPALLLGRGLAHRSIIARLRIRFIPSRTVRRTFSTRGSSRTRSFRARMWRVFSSSASGSATRPDQSVLSTTITPSSARSGSVAS